jgi:hypothetical protein
MSGPLTVPFAFLALFVEQKYLKALFGVLAILCAGFSSYWIWKREREERSALEERLEPKLELIFGEGAPFVDTIRETHSGSKLNSFQVFRVGVKNLNSADIWGVQIEFEGFTWGGHSFDSMPLRLWHGGSFVSPISFDLRPGQVRYVDVAMRALPNPLVDESLLGLSYVSQDHLLVEVTE